MTHSRNGHASHAIAVSLGHTVHARRLQLRGSSAAWPSTDTAATRAHSGEPAQEVLQTAQRGNTRQGVNRTRLRKQLSERREGGRCRAHVLTRR